MENIGNMKQLHNYKLSYKIKNLTKEQRQELKVLYNRLKFYKVYQKNSTLFVKVFANVHCFSLDNKGNIMGWYIYGTLVEFYRKFKGVKLQ